MTDIYQGDPAIKITGNGSDLTFIGGQPVMDSGVENQAMIALFTSKGWAGNFLFEDAANHIGSDFEKLAGGTITISNLALLEKEGERALKSPLFGKVSVSIVNPQSDQLDITINIQPPGEDVTTILLTKNGANWINQAVFPAHKRY